MISSPNIYTMTVVSCLHGYCVITLIYSYIVLIEYWKERREKREERRIYLYQQRWYTHILLLPTRKLCKHVSVNTMHVLYNTVK